ncbi:NUDIX hydrolase [Streptomyces sp. SID9124]|uniref:NUDIX hydrolase n=1 Tax=Streptomyces sp. SID9124 TaxID=2706108 RepID=UPI0013DE8BC0|nr:NUDIX hydrolase [Streptomyces sp. SID9124]NED11514.1 NUDIX hydrolase [Streptomyces sp. SID9124]
MTDMPAPTVRTSDVRTTSFGDWISVDSRTVHLADSQSMETHVVRFPAIALVVPLDGDDLVLIRQFRFPPQTWLIEAPAGRVEAHEDPAEAAVRELWEETGFHVRTMRLAGELRISPHLSDETTYVYEATGLTPGAAHPDKGEFIQRLVVSRTEARAMVREGRIVDAKTIAALALCDVI